MCFTQPALIMARWNSAQLFISCAVLEIFPSCSSALHKNALIPFIWRVPFVQEGSFARWQEVCVITKIKRDAEH